MEGTKETKKLKLEEMDTVSGGTRTESEEIWKALNDSSKRWELMGRGVWRSALTGGLSGEFSTGAIEEVLNGMGIEANCSRGFFGIGSKNNTYRDKETGAMLLHSEVLDYIKTGKKTW